jgi:hypothetical protein
MVEILNTIFLAIMQWFRQAGVVVKNTAVYKRLASLLKNTRVNRIPVFTNDIPLARKSLTGQRKFSPALRKSLPKNQSEGRAPKNVAPFMM